ncbi:MAG: biotin transporter BioY [Treponema sp.]|jgi:biotin transport system substrate-specific component|nr:biotin transporter BioY [Treponema sp.]
MKPLTKRKVTVRIALVALFAALIAAGTFITIPFGPVPFVLQNMFAMLAGLLMGPFLGGGAVLLYLTAGAIGAPVFAGAAGGFVHFLSPSGGYLYGYFLSAVAAGFIAGTPYSETQTPLWRVIIAGVLGMLVVYVPGVIQLKIVLSCAWWPEAFSYGFFPFLIGDAIKCTAAIAIAPRLRRLIAHHL